MTNGSSISCNFRMTESVQRQFTRKLFIGSKISLVVGLAGLVAYIVTSVLITVQTGTEPVWADAMLIFAVPFACGLIFVITLRKQYKNAAKPNARNIVYEFFADAVLIREFIDGRQRGVVQINYTDVIKTKETQDYLFFYTAKTLAFPLEKASFAERELNTVKALLKMRYDGETLALRSVSAGHTAERGGSRPEGVSNEKEYDIDGIFVLSGSDEKERGT